MSWHIPGLALASLLLAGCAEPSRNLYEGIRMRDESMQAPEQRASTPHPPSYDEYQKERSKLNREDSEKISGQ